MASAIEVGSGSISGSSIGTGETVFSQCGLPQPTSTHYPKHVDLPWHFSWIDTDAMIGGSSAPTERRHWKALAAHNVGLVVNLTEAAVSPPRTKKKVASTTTTTSNNNADAELLFDFGAEWDGPASPSPSLMTNDDEYEYTGSCAKCGHSDDAFDKDLFADVHDKDISVLFLPIPDGSVPRFEQIDVFLKEATKTIQRGKKVVVHCQAGVGRTGTFLAIYLINKYGFDPLTAITLLRHYRPQSLQFHATDWQVDPFRLHPDPKAYNRNMVQERFVERWWHAMMREKRRASMCSPVLVTREVSPANSASGGDGPALIITTTASDASASPDTVEYAHKNKRRTSFVMESTRLIPDDEMDGQPHLYSKSVASGTIKTRRRHTDSAATYDNFMDYLVAITKQNQHAKSQLSQLAPLTETQLPAPSSAIATSSSSSFTSPATVATTASSATVATFSSSSSTQSSLSSSLSPATTSMLSSSLTAIQSYPTPPRVSEMSSSFKRARDASDDHHLPINPTENSHILASTLSPQPSLLSPAAEPLSTSFTESFAKLSSSTPVPPRALHTPHASSYHHRKRHPKPNPATTPASVPKTTTFQISTILLKLIDQQLDSKFTGFQAHPCYMQTTAPTRVVVQTGGPATREQSRGLCYGCRGVVSVGPEKVESGVWPAVVPFPCVDDAPMSFGSPALSGRRDSIGFGAGVGGGGGWGSVGRRGIGVVSEEGGGGSSSSVVVGSVSSDLNGAVEAMQLEEVQRREVSMAVRNRVV